MNNENNKVTRITVDLSTTVKPIAISEEDALKKLEEDNKSQAQYKDESLEESSSVDFKTQEIPVQAETTTDIMRQMNKTFDEEKFNKANETLGYQTPEERKKQATKVLIIAIIIIVIILLIELPSIIRNFR